MNLGVFKRTQYRHSDHPEERTLCDTPEEVRTCDEGGSLSNRDNDVTTDPLEMSRNGRGLTDGIGFTNGSGLTIGNGMVNGLGMTDGLGSGEIPPSPLLALDLATAKTNERAESTPSGLQARVDLINGFSVESAHKVSIVKTKRRLSRKKRKAMRSMEKRAAEPIPGNGMPGPACPSFSDSIGDIDPLVGTSPPPTYSKGSNEDTGGEVRPGPRPGDINS